MKKRDRFDTAAKKELATPWDLNEPRLAMLFRSIAKAERARVRRLMRKQKAYFTSKTMFTKGYHQACDDILAALKEGR